MVASLFLVTVVEMGQQLLGKEPPMVREPLALLGLQRADPGDRAAGVPCLAAVRSGESRRRQPAGDEAPSLARRLRIDSLQRLSMEAAMAARRGVDANGAGDLRAIRAVVQRSQRIRLFASSSSLSSEMPCERASENRCNNAGNRSTMIGSEFPQCGNDVKRIRRVSVRILLTQVRKVGCKGGNTLQEREDELLLERGILGQAVG